MLFRIEDDFGDSGGHKIATRLRNSDYIYEDVELKIDDLAKYIANEVRGAVNGGKGRTPSCYSKSLGVALYKYNEFEDNTLYINCVCEAEFDTVIIRNRYNQVVYERFSINDYKSYINYLKSGYGDIINVCGYCIDISNNVDIDHYLYSNIGIHKKCCASPEIDAEVVIKNIPATYHIKDYLGLVYLIYYLQVKTKFLCNIKVVLRLKKILQKYLYEECKPEEFYGLCNIVDYINREWVEEEELARPFICSRKFWIEEDYYLESPTVLEEEIIRLSGI